MTGPMLTGKVAMITGAGRGIGKGSARVLAREGAKVLAVDFSGSENDTTTEIGAEVVPFHADVSKEDEVEAIFTAALETFGKVDTLLNVAGTLAGRQPGEVTLEEYERMTAVNYLGVLLCCNHGIRAMLQNGGGSIVNFTSVGALNCEDRAPVTYAAAKVGVHSITKASAIQYAAQGMRANVIAPGFAYTEIMDRMDSNTLREMSAKSVMGRPGRPEE